MNETDKEKLKAEWEALFPNDGTDVLVNGKLMKIEDWFISKIDHLIREGKEERTIEILAKVESATTAKEARHIIKDFLK